MPKGRSTARSPTRTGSPPADLRRPDLQADGHRATRRAHENEIREDYVEVIADLIDTVGEARAVDIAQRLGVTHVTVTKTVTRLRRDGLVTRQPYRSIFLTEQGRELAAAVRRRHDIVLRFLRAIGVSRDTALYDAEGIEHHVSAETLAAFERFSRRLAPTSR